jgi:hypothetical protein
MQLARSLIAITCLLAPSIAIAQEEAPPLPAPELPDEEPAEPDEAEPEEPPRVLMRIRRGQVDDDLAVEEEPEYVERDVARPIPGDLRTAGQTSAVTLPESEQGPPRASVSEAPARAPQPRPFSISAGVSFARLLAGTRDFVMIQERFEALLPEFPALRLGVGVSQLYACRSGTTGTPSECELNFVFKGGPRVGLGVHLFDLGLLSCDGVVSVQPGIMFGDIGTYFDLHADLDVRFIFGRDFEVDLTGGFSLIGETSFLEIGGLLAIPFG